MRAESDYIVNLVAITPLNRSRIFISLAACVYDTFSMHFLRTCVTRLLENCLLRGPPIESRPS